MTLPTLFIDGKPVQLGKRIGKGGEGEVYTLQNETARALKVYTVSDANLREPKIAAMLRAKLADRSALIAFPNAIVRTRDGRFAGFTMRLVNGHKPLFDLYAPGARKINFPSADYRFLVRAALNIAKAVAEVHDTSCVIGDINHSGILVSDKAIAALIDADSFQVSDGGKQHLCRVGVKEYTPPELHGQPLDRVQRSVNHDAFGLAIVIFQLLFMGRHPFVGRYSQGEMPIEKAITQHRFAYSLKRQVGMTPPPGATTLSDFPPPIATAFEVAFGGAAVGPRPTAKQWVALLDMLEGQLKRCASSKLHYYPSAAPGCPWCRMENSLGMLLFLPDSPAQSGAAIGAGQAAGFDIVAIWASIEAVPLPPAKVPDPVLPTLALTPSEDAKATHRALGGHRATGVLAAIGAIGILIVAANLWLLWIPLGIFGVVRIFGEHVSTKKLRSRLTAADIQWAKALTDWERRCGSQEVFAAKKSLSEAKSQLQNLPTEERNRLANYEANRREFQLQTFLASFRIRSAKIRGIGPSKEASLASYGIDTAADISHNAIVRVPGFGTTSARPLLDWRRKIEGRFVFSPQPTVADARERDRIVREIATKGDTLRSKLRSGPQMLRSASQTVMARWKANDPLLAHAYAEKEQAQVDWRYVTSNSLTGIVHIPFGMWVGGIILFLVVLGIVNIGSLAPRPTPSAPPTQGLKGPELVEFAEQKRFLVSPKAGVAAVNMRSGPGGEFAAVSQAPAGELVLGTGQSTVPDGTVWIAVTRSDGSKGYIAARLLKEAPAATPTPSCDSSAPWADYTVCSDGGAKAIDQEMRRATATLRKTLIESDRTGFDEDQARWLESRQSCAAALDSSSCLTNMYRDRIGRINDWPKSEVTSPAIAPETEVEETVEPPPPTIAVPARLRSSGSLVTGDDYPVQALRNAEQGVVTARFQVDETGRVSGCVVVVSSGSTLLDTQTCSLIVRRFRYDPARSTTGLPLPSTATKTVRWTLP